MARHLSLLVVLFVALSISVPRLDASPLTSPASLAADQPGVAALLHVNLDASAAVLPGPAAWRLLRLTVAPGSSAPLASHSGLLLWRVESGTVRILVQGPAIVTRAKTATSWKNAPQSSEFSASKGDALVFYPGTAMQYSNASKSTVHVLGAIIIPMGQNAPPPISYVGSASAANAFEGITAKILGGGVTDSIPSGAVTIAIDQITLASGQSLPASIAPTLYSLTKGSIKFKVMAGRVQISDGTQLAGQDVGVGATETLKLDADAVVFFPDGAAETSRSSAIANATLLRWTTASTVGPSTDPKTKPAKIKITGPLAPTPSAAANTGTPTAQATPKAISTPNG